ncbi:RPA-interacting protein [Camelus ferus]|nr:RPA-interacting protein [Camelus ferus]
MAEPSRHRSLYKPVGSPPWKETFRQPSRVRQVPVAVDLEASPPACGSGPRPPPDLLLESLDRWVWDEHGPGRASPGRKSSFWIRLEEPMDLAVLEEIQQELIDQEQSIISEYEKSLQFDEECLSIMLAEWEANPLICPVCTK